ncbi:tetraacyldisaccharide 4'-kinase [Azospirillum sp.]|uniref:tetraacyldisaccharide 4'-kinase n=1 Tax=Azospirillum sp. TaxID=34012 RepID=UPI002D3ECA57|nr:tetraacyldisaccharide 4'-kinase [Azospirillum sp.]HYD65959.1 tetraacyldisaccharide 4'-kinase [Azospirillum sp.]
MRTPAFWYRPPTAAALALAPLGALYGLAGRLRFATTRAERAPVPIVCVGNLVAGGAGKTPVALALAEALAARGTAVHFLTRGHGGTERGPLRVDPARHDAGQVGDEALLLASHAPTWVARDRVAGARAAAAAGAEVVVMDDGFQNPHLAKDLSLVVVDGAAGFGNGCLLPAGPLREPVARGLSRADAVVLMGEDRTGVAARVAPLPVLRARVEPDADHGLRGRRVLAFAGIGRPEKFFATLESLGAVLAGRVPFADHHPYTAAEVADLLARAEALNALPVTTAKDAVRLPADVRARVRVLPVCAVFDDAEALGALLDRLPALGRA